MVDLPCNYCFVEHFYAFLFHTLRYFLVLISENQNSLFDYKSTITFRQSLKNTNNNNTAYSLFVVI